MKESNEIKDFLIKRAKLRKKEGLWDISVKDGVIKNISRNISEKIDTQLDAEGNLVTESFVNPHLHLCKVYSLLMLSEDTLKDYHGEDMGKAMRGIEIASKLTSKYDMEWIVPNVRKALDLAARFGNTHILAFSDLDDNLEGVKSLLKVREEYKNKVEIRVAPFPQDAIVRGPWSVELIKKSMELGADVVGGFPWIEYTEKDEWQHLDTLFEIAKTYDKNLAMLVDDAGDPGLRSLEKLALVTIRENWQGRVLAQHARAMSQYPDPYFRKLVALLKKAELGIVSDPLTGPLHARVKDLIKEGALVVLGQDDITDAYYPYGRNNMLEVAFLASHLLWMTTQEEMEKLYDMITIDAATAMGLKDFALKVGNAANLVVLNEQNILEALRNHQEPKYVISHGHIVDINIKVSSLN